MNKVEFEIVSEIKSKGRPRATNYGKGGRFAKIYTPEDTIIYENLVKTEYHSQCGNMFFKDGLPLKVEIRAYFAIPTSKQKDYPSIACVKNKDLDNIAKIILDGLNGVAFDDDKQIVKLDLSKEYTLDRERVVITIERDMEFMSEEEVKTINKVDKIHERMSRINDKLNNPRITEKVRHELEHKFAELEEELKTI